MEEKGEGKVKDTGLPCESTSHDKKEQHLRKLSYIQKTKESQIK